MYMDRLCRDCLCKNAAWRSSTTHQICAYAKYTPYSGSSPLEHAGSDEVLHFAAFCVANEISMGTYVRGWGEEVGVHF